MSTPPAETSTTATPVFDLDLLEKTYGPTAHREFIASNATYQSDLWTWAFETLPALSDAQFVRVIAGAIYDSANMSRFRGFDHVHFKASAAYHESERRHRLAHPDEDCRATSLYQRAYNGAVRDAGHSTMASEIQPCTCSPAQQQASQQKGDR